MPYVHPIGQEESSILKFLYIDEKAHHPWKQARRNGTHRSKSWGIRTHFTERRFLAPEHPMPSILAGIMQRMRQHGSQNDELSVLASFFPNECNAIE